MADILKNILGGGAKPQAQPAVKQDSDFADFAGAAPEPAPAANAPPPPGGATLSSNPSAAETGAPWTKWYNVHERHSLSEFKAEGLVLIAMVVIFAVHVLGARANRTKAKKWIRAHARNLTSEFSLVGFGDAPTIDVGDVGDVSADDLIREKSLYEFATYASGRQNTAFLDVKLTLVKRFNPFLNWAEAAIGIFTSMFESPADVLKANIYPFDGKESLTVPSIPGTEELRAKEGKSTYDDFVWAVVNKKSMQKLRDDRYDLSLTATKDSPKLPNWLSVMSENAEITDTILTPELVDAIQSAGSHFEHLIISDQPKDKPMTLKEATSRKRIFLEYRLPSDNNYEALQPLFAYFLRLPDFLVQNGRFRGEVTRKIGKVREQMTVQLRKVAEDEKNEERALEREKTKKAKRDAELAGLDAKAQKKYLEKEREKEQRKAQKKQTTRG